LAFIELIESSLLSEIETLAGALSKELGVDIVILPAQLRDEDTQHLEARPVNTQFPSVMMCPIIKPVKKEI